MGLSMRVEVMGLCRQGRQLRYERGALQGARPGQRHHPGLPPERPPAHARSRLPAAHHHPRCGLHSPDI